jgi:hypothetical protein
LITCYLASAVENAIVNESSKNVSLIDIIEQMQAPIFPLVVPRLWTAFFVKRETGDPSSHPVQFRASMGSIVIVDQSFDVVFLEGTSNSHCLFQLQGFPVPQAGDLNFELFDGERRLGGWTVKVTQVAQVSGTQPPVN